MAPSVSRPPSFQLQSDHADQPVGHLLVAFHSGGVRDQDPAVIDVEERFFVERGLCQLFIDRLALRLVRDEPGIVEPLVSLGIGPGAIVLRRILVQEASRLKNIGKSIIYFAVSSFMSRSKIPLRLYVL